MCSFLDEYILSLAGSMEAHLNPALLTLRVCLLKALPEATPRGSNVWWKALQCLLEKIPPALESQALLFLYHLHLCKPMAVLFCQQLPISVSGSLSSPPDVKEGHHMVDVGSGRDENLSLMLSCCSPCASSQIAGAAALDLGRESSVYLLQSLWSRDLTQIFQWSSQQMLHEDTQIFWIRPWAQSTRFGGLELLKPWKGDVYATFTHLLLLTLSLDISRCRLETLSLLNLSLAISALERVHLLNAAYQGLDSTTKPNIQARWRQRNSPNAPMVSVTFFS